MLAGLLFGYGGSTGGMDAGTVNSGLTGGMANLLMTLTGGLAALAGLEIFPEFPAREKA